MVKLNIKIIQFNVAAKAFAGLINIILYLRLAWISSDYLRGENDSKQSDEFQANLRSSRLVCSRSTSEDYGEIKSKQKHHLRLKEKSCQVHAQQEKKNVIKTDWSKKCFWYRQVKSFPT